MERQRFAKYYENHPESYNISKILKKDTETIKAPVKPEISSKTDSDFEKQQRSDRYAYLEKSIEMKIEVALMFLQRSRSHLQYI